MATLAGEYSTVTRHASIQCILDVVALAGTEQQDSSNGAPVLPEPPTVVDEWTWPQGCSIPENTQVQVYWLCFLLSRLLQLRCHMAFSLFLDLLLQRSLALVGTWRSALGVDSQNTSSDKLCICDVCDMLPAAYPFVVMLL